MVVRINYAIDKESIEELAEVRVTAAQLKGRIDMKTLDVFPATRKLLHFLEVLELYTVVDFEALQMLFARLTAHVTEDQKDLQIIAKLTLANNLLLSEASPDKEFMVKNMRRLSTYLSEGILSLSESIEDRREREIKEQVLYWRKVIDQDESETVEFKSSLFTPILDKTSKEQLAKLMSIQDKTDNVLEKISIINGDLSHKALVHSAMKTLVAFANTRGGTLLIGVTNDKEVVGLEREYQSVKIKDKGRDGYGLYFDDIVRSYIGDSFSSLMERIFLNFGEGDVLIVKVSKSPQEVFLLRDERGGQAEQLYIRNLSSSKELKGAELAKYIRNMHSSSISINPA